MDSGYALYTSGSLVTQDIESLTRQKKIILLAATRTTYIEVNTTSANQI